MKMTLSAHFQKNLVECNKLLKSIIKSDTNKAKKIK